jgi:hypothetical protein
VKKEIDIDAILSQEYPHLNVADASMEYGHRIGLYNKKDLDEYYRITKCCRKEEDDYDFKQ